MEMHRRQESNPPADAESTGPDRDEQFTTAVCATIGLIKGRALMLAGDPALSEDLMQATFERALRARHRPPPCEIEPWLMRILKNAAIDHWRSATARPWCELDAERAAQPPSDEEPAWWCDLELADLERAAHRLPNTFRRIFLLRIQGCSHNEIARLLGLKVSTVATRFFRGRRLMQEVLAESRARGPGA
jgi:RNA polymerase sigma-70 factor (ECF subfamily)